MDRRRRPAPHRWTATGVAGIVAIVIIVGACGSTNPDSPAPPAAAPTSAAPSPSAEPSASPTASPSPSPSPSPSLDVAQALVAKVSAFGFSAKSTIVGELVVASARYSIGGTFDVSGVDHHTVLGIQAPGRQTVETLYKAGVLYQKTGTGPWYTQPPSLHDSDLSSFFRTVKTVTDAGVETKNGTSLHHLTLPSGTTLAPAVFGLTDPSMTGLGGSVEFWAAEDGTPGVMSVHDTWQQTVSGKPVAQEITIEFTFTDVNSGFAIAPPDQIWTTYTSKQFHMTYGHPFDWDLFKNQKNGKFKYDQAVGPDAAYADFYRFASLGFSANQLIALIKTNPNHVKSFHVDSVKSIKMAGVAGRQMLIHATWKGKKRYWIYTFALKGSYYYEVDFLDTKGHEADDLKFANEFAATVVIAK